MKPATTLHLLATGENRPGFFGKLLSSLRRQRPVDAHRRFASELYGSLLEECSPDAECTYRVFSFRASTSPGEARPSPLSGLEVSQSGLILRIGLSFETVADKVDGVPFYRYSPHAIFEIEEDLLFDEIGKQVVTLFESRVTLHLSRLIDVLRRDPTLIYWIGMPATECRRFDRSVRVTMKFPEYRAYEDVPPAAAFPHPLLCLHTVRGFTRALEDTRHELRL